MPGNAGTFAGLGLGAATAEIAANPIKQIDTNEDRFIYKRFWLLDVLREGGVSARRVRLRQLLVTGGKGRIYGREVWVNGLWGNHRLRRRHDIAHRLEAGFGRTCEQANMQGCFFQSPRVGRAAPRAAAAICLRRILELCDYFLLGDTTTRPAN